MTKKEEVLKCLDNAISSLMNIKNDVINDIIPASAYDDLINELENI